MDFDIEVQYRALYRSQNKVLRYRSSVSPIYGYTYIGVHASISKYMTSISKFQVGKVPDGGCGVTRRSCTAKGKGGETNHKDSETQSVSFPVT